MIHKTLPWGRRIVCGLRPASADPQANWLAGKVGNRKEEGGGIDGQGEWDDWVSRVKVWRLDWLSWIGWLDWLNWLLKGDLSET